MLTAFAAAMSLCSYVISPSHSSSAVLFGSATYSATILRLLLYDASLYMRRNLQLVAFFHLILHRLPFDIADKSAHIPSNEC
jgi:hypothetical protein